MILLYCMISTYDMIASLCMKLGLCLHAALRSFPYLESCVLEFVNNRIQPVGKTEGDTCPNSFAPSLSLRVVLTAFENFQYPWDAQDSTLLLFCLLNGLQVLFRVKQVVKNIVKRPAPGQDSCEWLGVWDNMGRCLEQWAPPVSLKLTPEQVQNPDNLVKYLQKVGTPERHKSPQCAGVWPTPTEPCSTWFTVLKRKGGETKRQLLQLALPPQPALQPLQPSRQSQPPQPAPRLLQPLALSQLPQLQLQPQLQPQASRLIQWPTCAGSSRPRKTKDAKRADRSGRDDNEPGSSREIETEIITRSLSLSELRDMRKDFSCQISVPKVSARFRNRRIRFERTVLFCGFLLYIPLFCIVVVTVPFSLLFC